jgi:hypothetical protein
MVIEIYQEARKEYRKTNVKLEKYCSQIYALGIPIIVFIDNKLTYKISKLYKSSEGRTTILRVHNLLTNQVTEVDDILSYPNYKELTDV